VNTIVMGNTIHPEYSNYLRTIFSIDDVGGQNLMNALLAHSDLGVDAKNQMAAALEAILGEDPLMFELNGHLLPREVRLDQPDGSRKIVQMDWTPIPNGQGQVEKILLITQDVTHLRELERSSAEQREQLDIIAKMIRVPAGKFNDFARSAGEFVAANRRLIQDRSQRGPEVIAALFRNMHTIKGNARTFELTHITDAAHTAEQTYEVLRKDPESPWDDTKLAAELDAVEAAVNLYVRVSEDTLGRKGRAADLMNSRGSFVSREKLARLRTMAAAQAAVHPDAAELQSEIDRLGLVSLGRLVSGSGDSLSSLARELCKPVPELALEFHGEEPWFNPVFAEAFKSCLMHILRNCLDHGIESPEDRQRADKTPQGRVRIESSRVQDGLELQISDDGRGLALQKLYELGVANGTFQPREAPSPEEVAESIFKPGVSTASQVTQVSGRGVGMDAVRSFLAEQGASIRIALQEAAPATEFVPFSFVIRLPRAVESYSDGQFTRSSAAEDVDDSSGRLSARAATG
jgi:chemotaxis protein histidine kinase CheA